jgi:hypothetical protein
MLQAPHLILSALTLSKAPALYNPLRPHLILNREFKIYKCKKFIFGFLATLTGMNHLTYEFINGQKFIFDVLTILTANRFFFIFSFTFEMTVGT